MSGWPLHASASATTALNPCKTPSQNYQTDFFFYDFIYLFMRGAEREAETQAEGEAGSIQEPDVRLDPRTSGSRPEPKADAQPLNHAGVPPNDFFMNS